MENTITIDRDAVRNAVKRKTPEFLAEYGEESGHSFWSDLVEPQMMKMLSRATRDPVDAELDIIAELVLSECAIRWQLKR